MISYYCFQTIGNHLYQLYSSTESCVLSNKITEKHCRLYTWCWKLRSEIRSIFEARIVVDSRHAVPPTVWQARAKHDERRWPKNAEDTHNNAIEPVSNDQRLLTTCSNTIYAMSPPPQLLLHAHSFNSSVHAPRSSIVNNSQSTSTPCSLNSFLISSAMAYEVQRRSESIRRCRE